MKPKSEFVLLRTKRESTVDEFGQHYESTVSIVKNNGKFDFNDYRFLTQQFRNGKLMEEWVHKDELDLYKKIKNIL